MTTMKEIYQAGIAVAEKLDEWRQTGYTPIDMWEISRAAVDAASEILPGETLSYVLSLVEPTLETDKISSKLYHHLVSNESFTEALHTELAAYTKNGIR